MEQEQVLTELGGRSVSTNLVQKLPQWLCSVAPAQDFKFPPRHRPLELRVEHLAFQQGDRPVARPLFLRPG